MPDYRKLAASYAAKYHLGPWYVRQIQQESGFQPGVTSPAGAIGIAQFMPGTARALGVDPRDPIASLDASARYMRRLVDKYGGSVPLALAAYNAGEGAVAAAHGIPRIPETQNYVRSIMRGGAGATGSIPAGGASLAAAPPVGSFDPSAGRQKFAQAVLGTLGQSTNTHQRMMGLIGAVLGLHRDRQGAAAATFLGTGGPPLASGGKITAGSPVVGGTSVGGAHPTSGLDGFPARDYFAPSGSTAVAPVSGQVVRLSGHDPAKGPTQGPHGPLGWSVYIRGTDGHTYYLTHMGSRTVKVGQTVRAGQPIGTVADYAHYGTPSHIHMGIH